MNIDNTYWESELPVQLKKVEQQDQMILLVYAEQKGHHEMRILLEETEHEFIIKDLLQDFRYWTFASLSGIRRTKWECRQVIFNLLMNEIAYKLEHHPAYRLSVVTGNKNIRFVKNEFKQKPRYSSTEWIFDNITSYHGGWIAFSLLFWFFVYQFHDASYMQDTEGKMVNFILKGMAWVLTSINAFLLGRLVFYTRRDVQEINHVLGKDETHGRKRNRRMD